MTAAIPTTEPAVITAGDTIKWTRSLADYPADDGWALVYSFVNAAGVFSVAATASGALHLATITATASASILPGEYDWRAQASKAGEVYTVATGRCTVAPTFSARALDARSQARRSLQAIEDTIEGRAGSAVAEYEIAGRRLKNIPISDLLVLRDRLRQDVAKEDSAAAIAAGLQPRGRIQVRFGL